MTALTLAEAQRRAELLEVHGYTVSLNLDSGAQTYDSHVLIDVTSREDCETFIDVDAVEVQQITLDGEFVDPVLVEGRRLPIRFSEGRHRVEIDAVMRFRRDGQGLHRLTDPADGEDYVYGHTFLDACPSVFACFDQPDLKAPLTLSVVAPAEWTVVANGPLILHEGLTWDFGTTPPQSTYTTTVCAGPFATHRDVYMSGDRVIPLAVHAKASVAKELAEQAPHLLSCSQKFLDFFENLFGIPYPYADLDHVFMPEFTNGGMENPGCVVYTDDLLFTSQPTQLQEVGRDVTVAHEISHMWFGNLVTMVWWDDLWLNESFADYFGHRAVLDTHVRPDAWVAGALGRRLWGYAADSSPSTHPVAGSPAPTTEAALANFDGISYAKGSASLGQLIAYIGDDAFLAGLRSYLAEYSLSNASFADITRHFEAAAGTSLRPWISAWLETTGRDELRVDRTPTATTLRRLPPTGCTASRPHRVVVAAYGPSGQLWRESVLVQDDAVALPAAPDDAVVIVNADERTWAKVILDDRSLAALPSVMPHIDDTMARSAIWLTLVDGVSSADVDPRLVGDLAARCLPAETSPTLAPQIVQVLVDTLGMTKALTPRDAVALRLRLADAAREWGDVLAPRTPMDEVAVRLYVATSADVPVLRAWMREGIPGTALEGDEDLRWAAAQRLASLGEVTVDELDALLAADPTDTAQRGYRQARASLPTGEAKAWAWQELMSTPPLSMRNYAAIARGLWHNGHGSEHALPYVERYFTEFVPHLPSLGNELTSRAGVAVFPRLAAARAVELAEEVLQRDDLHGAVRRGLIDGAASAREVAASQARYATADV